MTNKPDSEYCLGIDISKYDTIWNDYTNTYASIWNPDTATKRIDFVIQRVSYGIHQDSALEVLYPQVAKVGIRGAYHYFTSGLGWKRQLDVILQSVKNKNYHFYAIDYEKIFNNLDRTSFAEMMELVKQLKLATGKKVLIYFNSDVYQNYMKPYGFDLVVNLCDGVWFAQYPWKLFLDLNNLPTSLPKNITNCKIWQFGGDTWGCRGAGEGKDWGSPATSMDLNIFRGTFEDMKTWLGIDNVEIPPIDETPEEPEPIDKIYVKVKSGINVNLRTGSSTSYPIIISEKSNSILESLESLEDTKLKAGKTGFWLNVKDSEGNIGFVSSFFVELYNIIPIPAPNPEPIPETQPAIPGPFYLLSDGDISGDSTKAFIQRFPTGKLDAYPATVVWFSGRGNTYLGKLWIEAFRKICTALQFKRTWVKNEGWSNNGEIGRVQNVYFAHNKVWVNKINKDGKYEVDTYYANETPPDLKFVDKYRQGIMSVMYKYLHKDNGGISWSDLLLPVLMICRDRTEVPRFDKKYMKSLISVPVDCNVKVNEGGVLNIRTKPISGDVVGTYDNNEKVTILEFQKTDTQVWGKTSLGWIYTKLTTLDI